MVVLKYVGVSRLVILKFYFSHLSISFCFIYGLLFKSGRYYKGTYKTILSSLWFEVNYLVIYYLKILNPKWKEANSWTYDRNFLKTKVYLT